MQSLKYVGVALTAGVVGAAVALLIAPASGRETRKRLSRRFDEESRRMGRNLREEKENLLKKGREAFEGVTDFVTDEIESAQKKLSKAVRA